MRPRAGRPSLRSVLILGAMVWSAGAVEAGVRIIGPDEVQTRFTRMESGRLVLRVPGLAPQELVTRVDDPVVVNKGDGSFHPFDPATVSDAIRGLAFPVDQVDAVVYVLPFPRRAGLESAAAPGAILLSPGVRPIPAATAHAIVAHEFGHVVQYARAAYGSTSWQRFLNLRGLSDDGRDTDALSHSDRPREVFAEDFRALLGSTLARGTGAVENDRLAPPSTVPGLADYLRGLATVMPIPAPVRGAAAFPNPFVSTTTVEFAPHAGTVARTIEVVDVRGRIVRRETVPARSDGSASWSFDGREDNGARLAPGSYFVRDSGTGGAATRIVRAH